MSAFRHLGPGSGTWPDWRTWLVAAGVDGIDLTRGLRISLYSLGVQAAVEVSNARIMSGGLWT